MMIFITTKMVRYRPRHLQHDRNEIGLESHVVGQDTIAPILIGFCLRV